MSGVAQRAAIPETRSPGDFIDSRKPRCATSTQEMAEGPRNPLPPPLRGSPGARRTVSEGSASPSTTLKQKPGALRRMAKNENSRISLKHARG
eukprot:scaffold1369_cov172-Pinguiococcus_pyrenoidosus.AAC.2